MALNRPLCSKKSKDPFVPDPTDSSRTGYIGAHDTKKDRSHEQITRKVKFVVTHPWYDLRGETEYDFALAQLDEPVEYSETIQPICLPSVDDLIEPGLMTVVAGWGNQDEAPAYRKEIIPPIVSDQDYEGT